MPESHTNQELLQLTKICENLGADNKRAELMAKQLVKRAEQLSKERQISRTEAMNHLLKLLYDAS